MCGIVGIVARAPVEHRAFLKAGCDTMRHRGPDDAGLWWSDDHTVGLAHRRLSIIDLSPAGHQPMHSVTGRSVITFNGELYNYRELREELRVKGHSFASASDTEVVLAAYEEWGRDSLQRLNGMFALAIWDRVGRTLLLARDRAGEKPLFYRYDGSELTFASELKALMAHPGQSNVVDLAALDHYLAYGYVPRDLCMLQGFHKLPQGHALLYQPDANRIRVEPYWELPLAAPRRASDGEFVEQLESLLEDSVRRQMVADVPVAVLLSGGVDSSIVTAMAARASAKPVDTFTVSMRGEATYDEAAFARTVADHFGTNHTQLDAEPSSIDLIPALVRQYDEPLADSSMIPTFLVTREISRRCKVALGGDGGDELFGGYTHHKWLLQHDVLRAVVPSQVRRSVGRALEAVIPVGTRGRNYVIGYGKDREENVVHAMRFFDPATRLRLMGPALSNRVAVLHNPETERTRFDRPGQTVLQQITRIDFRNYLPDDILVKVDRASMLNSLEVRAPWLDYRLIEFAYRDVPDRLKATTRGRKILPRLLASKLLPASLNLNRKQGFSIPLHKWFKADWGPFLEDILLKPSGGSFERSTVVRLLESQKRGLAHTNRLFALAMFELWRSEYNVALPQ
jgi:asparagine synthase (glutamine-hydrolysing)